MSKRIDVAALPAMVGTLYPPPFDMPCRARERTKLGDPVGLTQFGVNLCRLPPGAWSSQRHWHSHEDDFVYVLSGMNGPEKLSFSTVVMMVGMAKSLAAFARTWALLKVTRRSCDCTPWYIAG